MTRDEMRNDNRRRFFLFWMTVIVSTAVLFILWKWFTGFGKQYAIFGQTISTDLLFGGLCVIYIALSFRSVTAPDIGVKLFFGKPIQRVKAGIVFVPFLVCSLRPFPGSKIQIELATPRTILDEEGNIIPSGNSGITSHFSTFEHDGSVLLRSNDPFRVTWSKEKRGSSGDDPLSNEITTDPRITVRLSIYDTIVFAERFNTLEQVGVTLADNVIGILQTVAGTTSLARARTSLEKLKERIQKKVGEAIGDPDVAAGTATESSEKNRWGIDIDNEGIQITDLGIPKRVNVALADRSEALAKKGTTITNAEATREQSILVGQGKGKARQHELEGEAAGLAKLAETAKTREGQLALQAQTAKDVWGGDKTKTVFMGNGSAGNPLMAAAMEGLLGAGDKGVPTPPTTTTPTLPTPPSPRTP